MTTLIARVIYFRWIGTMILFTYHKGNFDCNGSAVLHTYLVGLLVILGLIILSICAIVYVSAQGKFMIFFFSDCLFVKYFQCLYYFCTCI